MALPEEAQLVNAESNAGDPVLPLVGKFPLVMSFSVVHLKFSEIVS